MAEERELTEEDLKNMSPEELLELQKKNCIFCRIISGEIPSTEVYSDDELLCILDINPAAKGHVLVIPKQHYQILPQIPKEAIAKMFAAAQHISNAQLKSLPIEGTTIFVANGAAAGQRSPHFLFHVIPRNRGDGLFSQEPKEFPEQQHRELVRGLSIQFGKLFKAVPSLAVSPPHSSSPPAVVSSSEPKMKPAELAESAMPVEPSESSKPSESPETGGKEVEEESPLERDIEEAEQEEDEKEEMEEAEEEIKSESVRQPQQQHSKPQHSQQQQPARKSSLTRSQLDDIANLFTGGRG